MNVEIIPVFSSYSIFVSEKKPSPISDETEAIVNTIWKEESQNRISALTNGQMLTLEKFHPNFLEGRFVDYKYYLAQLQRPELFEIFRIKPVGINAVLLNGDKILIAKRSSSVTEHPNKWEFGPSGTIEPVFTENGTIDTRRLILNELNEEIGIDLKRVLDCSPQYLIFQDKMRAVDLCHVIIVNLPNLDTSAYPKGEYVDYQWLTVKEIEEFSDKNPNDLIPYFDSFLLRLQFL